MNDKTTHFDDESGVYLDRAIAAIHAETIPEDLRNRVLRQAALWSSAPPPQKVRPSRLWSRPVAFALAASLLFVVSLGAYFLATRAREPAGVYGSSVAMNTDKNGDGNSQIRDSLAIYRGSTRAIVAESAPIIVASGRNEPIELGAWIAQRDADNSFHIWDWSRSSRSRILKSVELSGRAALSPDGKLLVLASGEIINLESGARTPIDLGGADYKVDNATYGRIGGMQLSPDSTRIALFVCLPHEEGFPRIGEQVVQLLEFPTARVLCQFRAREMVISFSPDGKQIVAAEPDKQILVHRQIARRDTTTGMVLKKYEPILEKQVLAVALSPDGRFVAASQHNGDLLVWEADSGKLVHRIGQQRSDASVDILRFAPDGNHLAAADGFAITIYESTSGRVARGPLSTPWGLQHVRWSADGNSITAVRKPAAGDGGNGIPEGRYDVYPAVYEWDWQSGKRLRSMEAPPPK